MSLITVLRIRILFFTLLCSLIYFFLNSKLFVNIQNLNLQIFSHKRNENVKAIFVSLVRNRELNQLLKSIESIESHFNRQFKYNWIFFNNEEFTKEFVEKTTKAVSGKTFYELIPHEHWSYPSWINQTKASLLRDQMLRNKVIYGGSESYRHMCRYESGFFFRSKFLENYEYYWRVEPGTKIMCNLDYDVFQYMKNKKKTYGFTISIHEFQKTIPTLWSTVKEFIRQNPTLKSPNNLMDWLSNDGGNTYNGCHFWSNFEIASLDFWRSETYLKFFDFLDKSGGFFYERWGDAPVHSIALALFLPKHKIHFFDDVGYYHIPFTSCPMSDNVYLQKKCSCDRSKDITLRGSSCTKKFINLLNS